MSGRPSSSATEASHPPAKDLEQPAERQSDVERSDSDQKNAIADPEKGAPDGTPPAPSPAAATPTHLGAAAWLCVLGSSCCLYMTFGYLNGFGVYQSYYETTLLRSSTPSAISWIGSISTALLFLGNLIGGPLLDRFGPRPLIGFLCIAYTVACMLTSLCKEYYQVLLAQGVAFGLAASFGFAVPLACVMLHFKEKKAIAIGIVVASSSIGGVTWPFIVQALLDNVGFGWTWRAVGFIGLGLLGIAFLTVTSPLERKKKEQGGPRAPLFYLDVFKQPSYLLLCGALFFAWLGIFYIFFYIPTWAASQGTSNELQLSSVSILNACSFFGRLLVPLPSNKLGPLNMMTASLSITALITLAAIGAKGPAGVLVVGGFYGFFSGGAISLYPASVASLTPDPRRIGSSVGQLAGFLAIAALLGSPICGWIIDSPASFQGAAGFSGACLALGAILAFAARVVKEPNLRTPA